MNALERVTVNPMVMSGKPCIRSLRVTVANVLRLLATGHTPQRMKQPRRRARPTEPIPKALRVFAWNLGGPLTAIGKKQIALSVIASWWSTWPT